MIASFLPQTVAIKFRPKSYTAPGGDQAVTPLTVRAAVVAALIVPVQASEDDVAAGPMPTNRVRLYFAPGTVIKMHDRVTVTAGYGLGDTYSVEADAQEFPMPDGSGTSHVEAVGLKEAIT